MKKNGLGMKPVMGTTPSSLNMNLHINPLQRCNRRGYTHVLFHILYCTLYIVQHSLRHLTKRTLSGHLTNASFSMASASSPIPKAGQAAADIQYQSLTSLSAPMNQFTIVPLATKIILHPAHYYSVFTILNPRALIAAVSKIHL